ncbi:hypothetical protein LTR36_003125 [Oleoguttula mirabilis]|uniref:Nineteen complex-related protein 2-domain-containing protein n=1 Tax=Oleoguttula mirabilis TaxID=1507867 RepID=A0AAV9JZU2_9PEZI|nr:hypothetical protein LTR36_003125 [Oleoguttula mirabilis]
MKKSFSARRVPRKVGHEVDEPPAASDTQAASISEATAKRAVIKPRKSANLRASFGPTSIEDDVAEQAAGVVTPKRSTLSRVAIQRNASKRSSLLAAQLPARQSDEEEDRPSYSAESLQALKASTPSTPRDLSTPVTDDDASVQDMQQGTQALDLSSKFGSSLARYQQPSAIPSAAEIAEKKERRARAAKEQLAEEYISLDPDDPGLDNDDEDGDPNVTRDEQGRLILAPKDKYNMAESRLVREDEDIMENFDDFTEDGKMNLGRKAEVEAAKKRKVDMAAQIAQAEGSGSESDDSDASEKERIAAYEAAQTRHGTYAANNATSSDPHEHLRPKTPPRISPLPTLDGVLERLRKQVADMQANRMRKLQEMEALQREKVRLGEEEVRIQKALRETAEKFQQLRAEKGIAGAGPPAVKAPAGLELTPVHLVNGDDGQDVDGPVDAEVDENMDGEDAHADEDGAAPGSELGFGGMRAQDGWQGMSAAPGLGMSRPAAEEDDW